MVAQVGHLYLAFRGHNGVLGRVSLYKMKKMVAPSQRDQSRYTFVFVIIKKVYQEMAANMF